MSTTMRHHGGVAAVAAVALLVGTTAGAHTTQIAQLKQVGATAIVYRGPQIDVALSYRYAKAYPHEKWLLLDVAMMAANNPIGVPRAAIAVRTPDGTIVPMATQAAVEDSYGALAPAIMRANVAREPLNYLVPQRGRLLHYFARPGYGLAFPTAYLDSWHTDYGRLFFQIPGGVQPGQYDLILSLSHGRVDIPFTI